LLENIAAVVAVVVDAGGEILHEDDFLEIFGEFFQKCKLSHDGWHVHVQFQFGF
jgi:hypothetical protein